VPPATVTAQLPNAFHDAFIRELDIDFASAGASLVVDLWVGDLHAKDEALREARRRGTLTLMGLLSVRIEPPHADYAFTRDGHGIWVDGDFGAYPGEPAPPDDGLVRLWFFVQTWNARMTFTAKACGLEWT
jgi:hypothetical protein